MPATEFTNCPSQEPKNVEEEEVKGEEEQGAKNRQQEHEENNVKPYKRRKRLRSLFFLFWKIRIEGEKKTMTIWVSEASPNMGIRR